MVKILFLLALTFLYQSVCAVSEVATASVGERCGKSVRRHDGTTIQVVFLQCPGPRDRQDALFCCGNESDHHCCNAQELMSQRKKGRVGYNDSPGELEIFGDPTEKTASKLSELKASVDRQPSKSEICEDPFDLSVLIICPGAGDTHNKTRCCKDIYDSRRFCCTESEFQHNKEEVADFEEKERRQIVVTSLLFGFIFVFCIAVSVFWYCCVYQARHNRRDYTIISGQGGHDQNCGTVVYMNVEDKEAVERVKNLIAYQY